MIECPKCGGEMESMGYGDMKCPVCNHVEYAESEEDFNSRIFGDKGN